MAKENLLFASVSELEQAGICRKDAEKIFAFCSERGVSATTFKALANIGISWESMNKLSKNWYIRTNRPLININEQSPMVLCSVFTHREVNHICRYWKDAKAKKFRMPLDMIAAGISRDRIINLVERKKLGIVLKVAATSEQKEININCGIVSELMKLNGVGAVYAAKIAAHKTAIKDLSELDEILGRKGISKQVVKGSYRAVVLQAAEKPSLRTQLGSILKNGNHKLDNKVRNTLMKKAEKGMATVQMQSLKFIQANNGVGCQCLVDITAAPVTAFTAPYAKKGVVLGNSIGRNQFSGERLATDKVATVDFSDLVRADETSGKKIQEKAARSLRYLLGKIKSLKEGGKIYITKNISSMYDIEQEKYVPVHGDGVSVLIELRDCYALLNGYEPAYRMQKHDLVRIEKEWIKDEDIIMTLDADRCNIYSTSQKRQDTMMFFDTSTEENVKKFNKIFYNATHGEFAIREGEKVTGTMLVDAATRLSSHTCGMGMRADQGFTLKSFCILFDKDNQMDGEGTMLDTCAARAAKVSTKDVVGMQIQLRPHTVKATTKVVTTDYMQMTLEGKNLMTIHTSDVPEWLTGELRIKLEKGYDKMVKEATGVKPVAEHLEGYDGIVVVVDTEA